MDKYSIACKLYKGLSDRLSREAYEAREEGILKPVKSMLKVFEGKFQAVPEDEKSVLISRIFAPDPETGNPRSDLFYMLKGSDEGLKMFIKETFMNPSSPDAGVDDVDLPFETTRYNIESLESYKARLEKYINKQFNPDSE